MSRIKDLRDIFSTSGIDLMCPGYRAAIKGTDLNFLKTIRKEKIPTRPLDKVRIKEMRTKMGREDLTCLGCPESGIVVYLNGDGKLHGLKPISVVNMNPEKCATVFSRTAGRDVRLSVEVYLNYRNEYGNIQTRLFKGLQAIYVQLGMLQSGFVELDQIIHKKRKRKK